MAGASLNSIFGSIALCGMILSGIAVLLCRSANRQVLLRRSANQNAQEKRTVPDAELAKGAHASSHKCCACKHYISKFTPPTAWTARTMDPTTCQCTTDPETRAALVDMDPLVAEAFHNLTCSPLCRLPEELLLNITLRLDPLSVQCLRRTCRLFLRIYSSPEFASSHRTSNETNSRHIAPWPVPRPEYWSRSSLGPLLDADIREYCADCRAVRTGPMWWKKIGLLMEQYLHCSGCLIDHTVGLFSAAQRRASPETRICIGREGYVRVCKHRVVKWDEVVSIARQIRGLNFGTKGIVASVALERCKDPGHLPMNHVADAPQNLHQFKYPAVQVEGRSESDISMYLQWNGHLHVPDLGRDELGHNKQATPDAVRRHLDEFRKGVAEFIAPEYPPGRLVEMGCFDPNFCCCLRYSGSEKLPRGWQLAPLQGIKHPTCRADPEHRLRPLRSLTYGENENSQAHERRTGSHCTWAPVAGNGVHGKADLQVRIDMCPGGSQCLRVGYVRHITIAVKGYPARCVTPSWCQALDPNSYGLQDDDESFGVLWCRQKGCRNYYRYAKKAPVPLLKTHRHCGPSCPS